MATHMASTPSRDSHGRPLPPMPTKKSPRAESTYCVDRTFQIKRPSGSYPFIEILDIKILTAVDVGNNRTNQCFIAQVEKGPSRLNQHPVFIKVFDPLYVNPDYLQTISTACTPALPLPTPPSLRRT